MLAHQTVRTRAQQSKAALRAHVDGLPPAQQREFVLIALQVMAARYCMDEADEHTLPAFTGGAHNATASH
jgi:hypothetical protein